MQRKLHYLAKQLARFQPAVVAIGILALVAAGLVAIYPQLAADALLIPSLLLCCWSLLVFTLIELFRIELPEPDRSAGLLRRLRSGLRALLRNALALCFVGLTVALVVLSIKLLGTGVG